MSLSVKEITYTDSKSFSVELEFIVACSRVEGIDLIKLTLNNQDMLKRFENSAIKLLKAMKRDGIIKLYLFEKELGSTEKMESIYLLNKFPDLLDVKELSESSIYIKL